MPQISFSICVGKTGFGLMRKLFMRWFGPDSHIRRSLNGGAGLEAWWGLGAGLIARHIGAPPLHQCLLDIYWACP